MKYIHIGRMTICLDDDPKLPDWLSSNKSRAKLQTAIDWLKEIDASNRFEIPYMAESCCNDHIETLLRAIVDGDLVLA